MAWHTCLSPLLKENQLQEVRHLPSHTQWLYTHRGLKLDCLHSSATSQPLNQSQGTLIHNIMFTDSFNELCWFTIIETFIIHTAELEYLTKLNINLQLCIWRRRCRGSTICTRVSPMTLTIWSKFTKRNFGNIVQNRFNKSKILNAKGIFPNCQNIDKMKSEYKCRLSVD